MNQLASNIEWESLEDNATNAQNFMEYRTMELSLGLNGAPDILDRLDAAA